MTVASSPSAAVAPPVLVSLSAFGAAEVRRHGQAGFAHLALAAGADGVEVRSELLRDAASEFPALRGATAVYSSAEPLWSAEGRLDAAALDRGLAAAQALAAPRLKMSIGGFAPGAAASLPALKARLTDTPVELLIENDQTESAGTLPALQGFFAAADDGGLSLGMTFDMGNWHWLGECPLRAAEALGPRVRYVHCKGVQRLARQWVAVPLDQSAAPWRALLRLLPAAVAHAIEYPLVGDDLVAVTREQVALLRALGSRR